MSTTTTKPISDVLDRMWIDVEGLPFQDLSRGKTLRAVHHLACFVLAGPGAQLNDVIAEAREVQVSRDVPVLLVLLDDEDLEAIDRACGWDGHNPWSHQVPVRDINMSGVGSIRLNSVGGTNSPCEHGYMDRAATVARVLHKDDLFMVIDRNDEKRLLVYRALADYDRRKNRVLFERTTPGVENDGKQYMELAPNLLVYVTLHDIEEAQPISPSDAREIAAQD